MKRIKGMTEIKVSVDDVVHLNNLIDRDEPKPAVIRRYSDGSEFEVCPICDRVIVSSNNFCSNCGQRIDRENVAL